MKIRLQREWRGYVSMTALMLGLLAGCGGGGGGGASTGGGAPVTNTAPVPALTLAGAVTAGAGDADVATTTGAEVTLDASGTKDPEGDALTYAWSLTSKPAGSAVTLSGATAKSTFKPDVAGTYVANLHVSDSKGASADKQATILVRANAAPVLTLTLGATYNAQPTTLATQKVSIGATVMLDGSGSRDADGDPVTTTWEIMQRPAGSNANLTLGNSSARFTADVAGTYKVRARGTDPSGAYSETIYPIDAVNNIPQTVVVGSVTNVTANAGANTVSAAVGYTVALSGTTSRDPDGGTLTYAWTLVSKPAASTAQLSAATGAFSQIVPDVLGDYVVKLVATNGAGASSMYQTTVSVRNQRPIAAIGTNATPNALPSGPSLRLPVNTIVTLRGTASTDADGDPLTYLWTLVGKPASSKATLSGTSGTTTQLTTDVAGSYQVSLRVTDPSGAFSERMLTIDSGNTAPVAIIDKSRLSVLAGSAANASGTFSYDDDGDVLQYTWAIDARPVGSSATIASPSGSQLSFTPDVAGTYVASLTVSDGKASSVAYVTIKALGSVTTNVALPFVPLDARYSKGLDRFVAIATNPNALYTVDPFTGTVRSVPLPLGVKAFSLSPDGKLAAVLHEGILSLVDLEANTLVRSTATGGSQTDAFVTNDGIVYMIGQTGGQWVDQAVTVINGRTGTNLTSTLGRGYASLYGTQRGIFAASKNKIFLMSFGLSPADIDYITLDPKTGAVATVGDSPYHGDYAMSTPLYLSATEDLLFTSSGNYFSTDTLRYAGKLTLANPLLSLSHSATADELLVLTASNSGGVFSPQNQYESSYHRFTGPLFLPAADVTLPAIGGQQSYGIGIYHSANDNHVALVQTGSATQNAAGVKYYLVTR